VLPTPAAGDVGDFIAVYLTNNSNSKYKPFAMRAGQQITAAPVIDFNPLIADKDTYKYVIKAGTTAFVADSAESVWPDVLDWTKTTWTDGDIAADAVVTWSAYAPCDTKIWADASACLGVDKHWGIGAVTAPSKTANGSVQWYHWLADKKPNDPTKVFQIEDGAELRVIINEHHVPHASDVNLRLGDANWDGLTDNTGGYATVCVSGAGTWNAVESADYWAYQTWTFSGATGLISVSAAMLAVAALME